MHAVLGHGLLSAHEPMASALEAVERTAGT
jgi:hypothetical protein